MGIFSRDRYRSKTFEEENGLACFGRGIKALEESLHEAAICFRKGAEKFDDGQCQFALGKLYLQGKIGANVNLRLAAYWLKKAAYNGISNRDLFFNVGLIYLTGGDDVVIDEEKALEWFEKAAELNPNCYTILGDGFYEGRIQYSIDGQPSHKMVNKNYKKSLSWYTRAVETLPREEAPATEIAHLFLEGGYGIDKDYKQALQWSEQFTAEKSRTPKCLKIIAKIYKEGGYGIDKDIEKALALCLNDRLSLSFDAGEVYQFHIYPPDYENALKYYQKALQMDSRHEDAKLRLGYLYLKGLGVEKNYELAKSYLVDGYISYYKGYFSHYGIGTAVDYELAYNYYKGHQIGNKFYGKAMNRIGLLYQKETSRGKDYKQALSFFKLAAADNCYEAYNSLGDAYKYGYGVNVDYDRAFKWYSKAAEEPMDNGGQYNLAIMYSEGKGTKVDFKLALHWFEKAQHYGSNKASSFIISQTRLLIELSEKIANHEVTKMQAVPAVFPIAYSR